MGRFDVSKIKPEFPKICLLSVPQVITEKGVAMEEINSPFVTTPCNISPTKSPVIETPKHLFEKSKLVFSAEFI